MSTLVLMWLISGSILVALELIIPGGIIVFLGVAAIIVSGLAHWGILASIPSQLMGWIFLSLLLLVSLREVLMKFLPGDRTFDEVDEDILNKGSIVEVVEDILPYKGGRVRFQNSTWKAESMSEIKKGEKAVLEKREDNILIIRPIK